MLARLIDPESPCWAEALAAAAHDFHHLPAYVRLEAERTGGEPLAFLAEEGERRFLLPLLLRPVDGTPLCDAASPYGYPGPVLTPSAADEGFVGRCLDALAEALRRRSAVTCFVRLHPLLPVPSGPLAERGRLVEHGDTVWVDLTQPPEELWHQTDREFRRQINKHRREGQAAEMDERWEAFDDFVSVYHDTMRRLGADESYLFPRGYFTGLRAALGERLRLCVVRAEGRLAAAALFTEVSGLVQYHLCGTHADFVRASPTKTLIHFARLWARERGNRVLNLGGGVGGRRDALLAFKAGFSPLRAPFRTWRRVVDAAAYDALLRRRQADDGAADDLDGYFPAYRKPSGSERPSGRGASVA